MSYDCPDLVQDLTAKLEERGFTFHDGDLDDGNSDESGFWVCWCGPEGNWDVECTETRDEGLSPVLDALDTLLTYHEGARAALIEACRKAYVALDRASATLPYADQFCAEPMDEITKALEEAAVDGPDGWTAPEPELPL